MGQMNRYIPPQNCGTWGGTATSGTAFNPPGPFQTWGAPAIPMWLPIVVVGGLLLMGLGILKEPRL